MTATLADWRSWPARSRRSEARFCCRLWRDWSSNCISEAAWRPWYGRSRVVSRHVRVCGCDVLGMPRWPGGLPSHFGRRGGRGRWTDADALRVTPPIPAPPAPAPPAPAPTAPAPTALARSSSGLDVNGGVWAPVLVPLGELGLGGVALSRGGEGTRGSRSNIEVGSTSTSPRAPRS